MPDPEQTARAALRRSLLLYSLFLGVAVIVVASIVASGPGGAGYVTLSVVGLVGLLLAYHVWEHILDLRSPLAESEGFVDRKWKRADLIIAWDSFYIAVERRIFRLDPADFIKIDEGMYVKVVHFPRTLNVVSVHEVLAAGR